MGHSSDIDRYVKDPSLLVDLFRAVVTHLDAGSKSFDTVAMGTQLREISKAMEKLEKMGVAVPDPLRAEKTRLAATLSIKGESQQALSNLVDDVDEIIQGLKIHLGRDGRSPKSKKQFGKRSNLPKTDKEVLRKHIVSALRKFGGGGRVSEVLDEIETQLKGKFLPGDLEIRQDGKTLAWKNNAQWERFKMVKDGTLHDDSPNGTWELSKDYL